MEVTVSKILYIVGTVFMVLVYALLLQGVTRKIQARVGRRYGIRVYQPFIDILKNFAKRTTISHGVMFYLGPVFRLTGGIGVLLFIPVIYGSDYFSNISVAGDLLLVAYFMFFGTLGMALGAGESGHPYSGIGVSRGLAQMTAAEIPLTMAIISIAVQYQSLSITDIVAAQQGGFMNWTLFTNPFAVAAAMISLIAGMMRSPFSVVIAPQEIPIGPPTEYHSSYLSIMQKNRALFPVAKTIFFMNLFFGGATSVPEMIIKTFFIYMWTVFVGTVFPRFRVDQSVKWFLRVPLVLGLISIILIYI